MSHNDFAQHARQLIAAAIATQKSLLESPDTLQSLALVSQLLIQALTNGGKVILFGNGGSAADAQHIAAELVGRFAFDRPALPALALTVNGSCLTAIANDTGFDQVFSRQLEALAKPGDVAIGISTSGNSPNVLKAILTARKMGLKTVGLTGAPGGSLGSSADYCIRVPSSETPRIQECHTLIGHVLADIVEREIFREKSRVS